jgi:hypothetical protein
LDINPLILRVDGQGVVGEQRQAALAYAHKIVANAPLVVQLLKRFVDRTRPKWPASRAARSMRLRPAQMQPKDFPRSAANGRQHLKECRASLSFRASQQSISRAGLN